jgi:hypothetical protein
MVRVASTSQKVLAERIAEALKSGLATAGITLEEIETEPIRGTKLIRVTLVAKGFERVNHTERQDIVWRILNRTLTPDEQLRVSMVVTLTPKELAGAF